MTNASTTAAEVTLLRSAPSTKCSELSIRRRDTLLVPARRVVVDGFDFPGSEVQRSQVA